MIKKIKDNKILRILFMVVKTIITLFVILVVSLIFIQRLSNNKITLGGYGLYGIITESMLPKYEVGDMLLAKKVSLADIKVGDDLVYKGAEGDFKDKIVTHRVINIEHVSTNQYYFHTQGLSNMIEDPKVSGSQVLGIIAHKCVILSLISKLINSTFGLYFAIFVPFVVMLFLEIISVINDKK